MEIPTLVLSDPPHGVVDVGTAAELLGLDLAGTRLKVKFPAPEVLSASDAREATEFAAELRATGLSVAVIDGAELDDIPWPDPVTALAFDDDGITASLHTHDVHISYDQPLLGVYSKPPAGFSMRSDVNVVAAIERGDGPAIAEGIQWMTILDLYFRDGGRLRRISIVPSLADFSSLGALRGTTAAETMKSILDECEGRFGALELDTRLEDVRPRQRFIMGEAGFDPDLRKRYSFGTLLLCHVLDSISAELRDVPQYELGSRMAYALRGFGTG
jgi:hypothetical protein